MFEPLTLSAYLKMKGIRGVAWWARSRFKNFARRSACRFFSWLYFPRSAGLKASETKIPGRSFEHRAFVAFGIRSGDWICYGLSLPCIGPHGDDFAYYRLFARYENGTIVETTTQPPLDAFPECGSEAA